MSEQWKSPDVGPVVNQEEVAPILGLHVGTVYRMRNRGELPPEIPGNSGRPIWLLEDIERFAEQRRCKRNGTAVESVVPARAS